MRSRSTTSRTRSAPADPVGPFRRAQALQAGIKPSELTGRRFQRVFHDVYLPAGIRLSPQRRAEAALSIFPEAYASHATAARIWGGSPPDDGRTHLSFPDGNVRSRRRGIAAHRSMGIPDLRERDRIRLSSPSQCFCEVATGGADLVSLVVLGDSLVGAGATTPEDLIGAADGWPHQKSAMASRAARFVRTGVDSPMESRLRMLIVLAGLPEPVVNQVIRHQNGDWSMRFDLCYPELKLLIEYDGGQHISDSAQRARDLERREELDHRGWRTVVIQKEHLYGEPGRVLDRIRQARLDQGATAASCRIRKAWRNYSYAG